VREAARRRTRGAPWRGHAQDVLVGFAGALRQYACILERDGAAVIRIADDVRYLRGIFATPSRRRCRSDQVCRAAQ